MSARMKCAHAAKMRAAFGLALGIVLTSVLVPEEAAGQDGWFHVDDSHPLRVEDAYALKLYEWEWQLAGEAAGGDHSAAGAVLELKTGLFRNFQVGVEAHGATESTDAVRTSGIEEFGAHVLYNLNEQGARAPAFGVRIDAHLPGTGELGRERVGARVAALLTRTFAPFRVHTNVGREFAAEADGGDVWLAGLALERALGLSSRSVLLDVYAEMPDVDEEATVWVEAGSRLQVTRRSVLAVGAFVRVAGPEAESPRAGIRLGWTRSFGIRVLTPVPRYPDPAIR